MADRKPAAPTLLVALLAAAALHAAAPSALPAQEQSLLRASRQYHGQVERMAVDVRLMAGEVRVSPGRSGSLYRHALSYDPRRFRARPGWSVEDGRGRLRIGLEGEDGFGFQFDPFGLGIRIPRLEELNEASGQLDLRLGPEVPVDLSLDVGAAETVMELGGIPLGSLTVRTGASDTRLRFSTPNPVPMERMRLEAGAASFHAERLGNAGFRRFSFDGGVGDVRLDFRGEWRRDATATLNVGVGALTLVFPDDLGVEVRRKAFLTSFDAPGFRRDGSVYRSPNWDGAARRLRVTVSAGLGAVTLRVRN